MLLCSPRTTSYNGISNCLLGICGDGSRVKHSRHCDHSEVPETIKTLLPVAEYGRSCGLSNKAYCWVPYFAYAVVDRDTGVQPSEVFPVYIYFILSRYRTQTLLSAIIA
ncbi:hypothetical protein DPMN_143449 [Dreissena polymorpha]|uniref:Uncharacterized protein n=1 Tax=Dreissena polymorpha TaxID=45954 RepID=A0A9D4GG87_DREPO|nr:hypothetical protein DPMN_143449 [Dreissena polymorpha]